MLPGLKGISVTHVGDTRRVFGSGTSRLAQHVHLQPLPDTGFCRGGRAEVGKALLASSAF